MVAGRGGYVSALMRPVNGDITSPPQSAADTGLDRKSGSFSVTEFKGENPLYRHGQIQVAPSGRYLAHADGTPFFFMADTCWNGPHLSEPGEWDTYLSDRAAKEFSAVIFTAPHFRGLEANADGRTAFTGRERIAIDPLYFQRLDQSVDAINDRGLLAVPLILHAGKDTERNSGYFLPEDQAVALDALHHRPLRRPSRPLGSRGGG